MEEVLGLFSKGVLRPMKETKVFSVNEIRDSFRYLQTGKHIGKAVIRFGEKISPILVSSIIVADRNAPLTNPQFYPGRKSWNMPSGGTILLIGGLGGLGRSYSAFISEHGAKHITFVSRGGAKPEDAQFLKYLEDMGCKIHVAKGDISVRTEVERIVKEVSLPVIGVIQGAMVLEVCLRSAYSALRWISTLTEKIGSNVYGYDS